MINAVIYARYSSHNQREESIEGQVRKCTEYAQRNDFNIVRSYCDRAISGKTDNRAEFQKMIRDSEKGQFQAVIMYTVDRFARNRYDAAMYKAKLKKNGVKLYYTEQSISEEPEGIILESVLEGMAEYYSENLSRGVRRGLKENALKCMVTGGTTAIGFRIGKDKRYELDPLMSKVVDEMYDLCIEGNSLKQIERILEEKGYRTPKGNKFHISTIASILRNKKNMGTYIFDDIEIENGIPAIVSKEKFERVQTILEKNKKAPGHMKAPDTYLLTGKLFCGHCESTMVGECGRSRNGEVHHYYACSNRKKHKGCHKHNERKAELEEIIVRKTVETILKPDVINTIATTLEAIALREFDDKTQLMLLQAEQHQIQVAIQNLLRLVEKGLDTDDVGDRLMELTAQKNDIAKQIANAEDKRPVITKEKLAAWLTSFLDGDIDDQDFRRRVIDALVFKVYLFDTDNGGRKFVILYNTTAVSQSEFESKEPLTCSDFIQSAQPKIDKLKLVDFSFVSAGHNIIADEICTSFAAQTATSLSARGHK